MNEKKINIKKTVIIILITYIFLAIAFYNIAGKQLHVRVDKLDAVSPETVVGELVKGDTIEQYFDVDGEQLNKVGIRFATYGRKNSGYLDFFIISNNKVLKKEKIDVATLADGEFYYIDMDEAVTINKSQRIYLKIVSENGVNGNAVTIWKGTGTSTGRVEIKQELKNNEKLYYNGKSIDGKLCFELETEKKLLFGDCYGIIAGIFGLSLFVYLLILLKKQKNGEKTYIFTLIESFVKYKFLLIQLVSREFKTKYKRSVLGILWSFLNPLLTMMVQYIVFSTIFKSSIPNFAVYLLIGIVCFGFFTEGAGSTLISIVGNATLITKVYVPKYIYPISKICSSTINLLFSLIPLIFVLIITKTTITKAILLAPFGFICLILFTTGIGLILASAMVFFRDTQFLWGVVSLLWMYATPIFYPESIIPGKFLVIYKMNPLYHFVRFIRITLIDGVSPEPRAYLMCLIASIIPLIIGCIVFKKSQDKFVLNI